MRHTRPGNKTAKTAALLHVKKRFRQRYGLDVSRKDLSIMVRKIQAGEATLLHRQSNSKRLYLVDGYRVVYSNKRKCILTVLPNEIQTKKQTPQEPRTTPEGRDGSMVQQVCQTQGGA